MKFFKLLMTGAAISALASCHANGDVEIVFEQTQHPDTLIVSYTLMSNLQTARSAEDVKSLEDTLVMLGNKGNIELKADSAAEYRIFFPQGELITFYAEPKDHLTVTVTKMKPEFEYTVTGSPLMDGMTKLAERLKPIEDAYAALMAQPNITIEERNAIADRYNGAAAQFIKEFPDNPASSYALMTFDGEEYLDLFSLITPKGQQSMFYPVAAQKAEAVKEQVAKQKKQKEMQSGNVTAPNFKLKDLKGKDVSLTDFRGKYVVLDFWGSWCVWCIKGIPELKEAYAKYKGDNFEVIGIDCRDSDEKWRAAVEKYELPWVNVYNPDNSNILEEYQIQGFPTKVIINPEGKIVTITVGEDPEFYQVLAKFMGK